MCLRLLNDLAVASCQINAVANAAECLEISDNWLNHLSYCSCGGEFQHFPRIQLYRRTNRPAPYNEARHNRRFIYWLLPLSHTQTKDLVDTLTYTAPATTPRYGISAHTLQVLIQVFFSYCAYIWLDYIYIYIVQRTDVNLRKPEAWLVIEFIPRYERCLL